MTAEPFDDTDDVVEFNRKRKVPKEEEPDSENYRDTRNQMVGMWLAEASSERIAEQFGCSVRTVARILKQYKETGSVIKKPKSGRPKEWTDDDVALIYHVMVTNNRSPLKEILLILEMMGRKFSMDMLRNLITMTGLKKYVAARKPLLSEKSIAYRHQWTQDKRHWAKEDWQHVIFSDESFFTLFGTATKKIWREPGDTHKYAIQNCIPRVQKNGGGVMVWSFIWHGGVGPLVICDGARINSVYYCDNILSVYQTWLKDFSPFDRSCFLLQEDNASCHVSKATTAWKNDQQMRLLQPKWPATSPDLNPIEHCWNTLEKAVRERRPLPSGKAGLIKALQEEWAKLSVDYIDYLYDRQTRAINSVWEAEGKTTRF